MTKSFAPPEALQAAYRRWNIQTAPAVEANGLVYLSGLTAVEPDGEPLSGGGIEDHAASTFEAISAVLASGGLTLDHVIKVNCWLADPTEDFAGWNAAFLDAFQAPYPARTTVGAPLVFGRIEVDVVAAVEPRVNGGRS